MNNVLTANFEKKQIVKRSLPWLAFENLNHDFPNRISYYYRYNRLNVILNVPDLKSKAINENKLVRMDYLIYNE